MFDLLLGITGILFGLVLAKIAPEELNDGRIYFELAATLLFLAMMALPFLYVAWWMALALALLGIALLFMKKAYFDAIKYLYLLVPYFLVPDTIQIFAAIGIFLYGLPAGTLWQMKLKI